MHYTTKISPLVRELELKHNPIIIRVNRFDEESAKVISATSAGEKFLSLYEDPEGLLSKIEAGEESVSDSDLS